MAANDDEPLSALREIQKRWRMAAIETRLRELDEKALKRWHWLEIYIEKVEGYGPSKIDDG